MAFTLPALPFAPDALEPHIDTMTMQIHHGKHHQAYVDNLNKAIAGTPNEGKSLEDLVQRAGAISAAVRNNGGGHWNHSFFWESLAANAGGKPKGKLGENITRRDDALWQRLGMADGTGQQTGYFLNPQSGQSTDGCSRSKRNTTFRR
jgi:superoxide dismutase